MRILFLDDMKTRRDAFKNNAIGHSVDFAVTANQAVDLLKINQYDVIYLDYDLENEHYNSNEDYHENGVYVAHKLNKMIQHYTAIVIVHSLNPVGRTNIKDILDNNFDVWTTENFSMRELWKIEVSVLLGAIKKYKTKSKE